MKRKSILAFLLSVAMILLSFAPAAFAQDTPLPEYTGEWTSFRGNPNNMGVTSVKLPTTTEDTVLKWAQSMASGWLPSMPPIIVNGDLYTARGSSAIKVSTETGEILAENTELAGAMGYSQVPLAYGEGMIFLPIGRGRVQALRADTLESVWVSEENDVGGQTLSPITYHGGRIFTGTWNAETEIGEYFCISVSDETTLSEDGVKSRDWSIQHTGGFYWAGAYATKNYVVFGSDDGTDSSDADSSTLYSVNPKTGDIIDKLEALCGDIRSTLAYDEESDIVYFTKKGRVFYQVKINADGTFDDEAVRSLDLGGMSTSTPIVYDGLAYLGISGSEQFSEEISATRQVYAVIDISKMEFVTAVGVPGYAQGSGLLTDAYKAEDGKVYVYTTYNNPPGGIYVIEAQKSVAEDGEVSVSVSGKDLFLPQEDKQNYCLCSIICDSEGALYFANDSGYMFSVRPEKKENAIKSFKIESVVGDIDEENKTISLKVSKSSDLTALTPEISVSDNATVLPASGETVDFTDPVTYTVTAENGETQEYTVTVTKSSGTSGSSGGVSTQKPKDITVCVTVEKLTLGQGYIVEPILMDTTTDESVANILCDLLDENGIDYDASNENGFYLKGIEDGESGENIPDYIKEELGEIGKRSKSGMLSEFDYSETSGWMYMVNGKIPSKSASAYKPKDGDVIRWQFTLCAMGADLKGGTGGLAKVADKDDLIYEIAELKASRDFDDIMNIGENAKKYKDAIAVLEQIDSTQDEVDEALSALKNLDEEDKQTSSSIKAEESEKDEPTDEQLAEQPDEPQAATVSFNDIENHWAKSFIEQLAAKGHISGKQEGSFAPDDSITRAEFLAILFRMSGEASHGNEAFEDVGDGDWFKDAVIWAAANGVASGVSNTEFAPDADITREQMAVMLKRYIDCFGIELAENEENEEFADAAEISAWAANSVAAMQRLGIISGKGNNCFMPKDNATRAEAARRLSVLLSVK